MNDSAIDMIALPLDGHEEWSDGLQYPHEYKLPYLEFAPDDQKKQVWINGVTLDIAPGFLLAYFYDLRHVHENGITIPEWSEGSPHFYTWSDYLWFNETEWEGCSAFTHNYLRDMTRYKVAVLESAIIAVEAMAAHPRYGPHMATRAADPRVREMARFGPDDYPENSPEYKSQFKAAVTHVRKAAAALDFLIKAAEDSGSLITCWGQPDCKIIIDTYTSLGTALIQQVLNLPHLRRELSDAEHNRRSFTRLINLAEAKFNKWVKHKLREINAQTPSS